MSQIFITRDIPFLKQNKIQSGMSKYIEQINQINGYYKQPNYHQKTHKKQILKGQILLPNFKPLDKQFEDHTKQIEDEVIREWTEKMALETKFNSSSTVQIDHIMNFLKQMAEGFNNMLQYQIMPKEDLRENKKKKTQFEKDFMLRQIEDSKVTITMFTTLINQVSKVLDCEQIVDNKYKLFIENQLNKYKEIIRVSSDEIVNKGIQLLSDDQQNILNKNVKNTLLQKLLDIEQTFIDKDSQFLYNHSSIFQKKIDFLQSSLSHHPKNENQKALQDSSQQMKTVQTISQGNKQNVSEQQLTTSSHKEIEYLEFALKEYKETEEEEEEKETLYRFQQLMKRLIKIGNIVKINQTENLHEMIDIVNEFKTVLFLHNLVLKNQIEKHLKVEEHMNLYEKKQLAKKIEEFRNIIHKCFKGLECKRRASLNEEKPTFIRYMGDSGMITHKHFILNKDNLMPVLKQLDPSRFVTEYSHKQSDIVIRNKEQIQKHIKRLQKSQNSSYSLYSSPMQLLY